MAVGLDDGLAGSDEQSVNLDVLKGETETNKVQYIAGETKTHLRYSDDFLLR